jgi:hypothetical protein
MKFKYIVASQKKDFKDTLLYTSFCRNCIDFTDSVIFFGNNTESLAKVYNEGIKISKQSNSNYAIFVHDDVFINCFDFIQRISKQKDMFDVCGLAGNKIITVKEPVLWHLMSDRQNLRGCVAHGSDKQYAYTSFGPIPDKVILIDGVFMLVNLQKLPDNVRFDESNPAKFHFYDLMFSLDCSLSKIKVGVIDIPIIHSSPGLRDMSKEWLDGQKYFLKKYEKYAFKTLTV